MLFRSIQLQYAESTGTQYIDTGIAPDGIELEFQLTRVVANQERFIFGSRTSANGPWFMGIVYTNGQWLFLSNKNQSHTGVADTNVHTVKMGTNNNNRLSFDGVDYGDVSVANLPTRSTYLFGVNNGGTKASVRIMKAKLYKNGELVRDLIPVVDPNGVVCLFDEVTKSYFYNQGTGILVGGDRV